MPKAQGCPCRQCTNCVRVSYYGELQFYAPSEETAKYYLKARETARNLALEWKEIKIEPWFIEGEF
jgi:hypothetical protein